MKIGILTFHRAHNYGAVLQCYALQEILKRMGHQVYVIDYRQPWIEDFYRFISMDMIRSCRNLSEVSAYLKKNLKKFLRSPFRRLYFRQFRDSYLTLTDPCTGTRPQDMDAYVIGSDQLWSLHCLGGKYDPVYMGAFDHPSESPVIGYAISADMQSVEALDDVICANRWRFQALSMREEAVAARVCDLTGKPCEVCLDPTLLTDIPIWEPIIDEKWAGRNYVLVYEVKWKKENKGLLRKKAEEIAEQIGDGCEVIDLSGMTYSVKDFVSMFRYARHVVTTSFHGTVFSIIFEVPFNVYPLWDGYDLRYMELLHNLGADDRVAEPDSPLLLQDMGFVEIKEKLDLLRKSSFDFLEKHL